MNLSCLLDFINTMEEKFPVSEWTIDNICIWPVIRNQLYIEIFSKIKDKTEIYTEKFNNKYMVKLKDNDLDVINYEECELNQNVDYLKEKVDAVFLGLSESRVAMDNIWYDRFCDPIIEEMIKLGLKCLSLEHSPANLYFHPTYIKTHNIQRHLDYITNQSVFVNEPIYNIPKYDEFCYELSKFFSLNGYGKLDYDIRKFKNEILFIRQTANYFKMIFNIIKPCIGFNVSYGVYVGKAFNLACKEFGIPSIDIQHGLTSNKDVLYSRWNNIPKSGYKMLPSIYWCWSNKEVDIISKWSKNCSECHRPIIGGNSWFDIWAKSNDKVHSDCEVSNIDLQHKNVVNILFTHVQQTGIPSYILEAIKKSPTNWKWIIRVHPRSKKEERDRILSILDKYKNSNIEYDVKAEKPILEVLKFMDVHVTMCSSSVIEAEMVGVPSVVTDAIGTEYYSDSIKSGWVVSAYSGTDVVKAIKHQLKNRSDLYKTKTYPKSYAEKAVKEILNIATLKKSNDINLDISRSNIEMGDISKERRAVLEKYLQILFLEKEYETIIDKYNKYNIAESLYYVGKAYQYMGCIEQTIFYLVKYLEKVDSENKMNTIASSQKIYYNTLFEAIGMLLENKKNMDIDHWGKSWRKVCIQLEIRYESIRGKLLSILIELYVNNQYEEILLFKQVDCGEVNFYIGRVLKDLKEYSEATLHFKKYLESINEVKCDTVFNICASNFLVSAYFHLGEIFYEQLDIDQAKSFFEKCIEITNHNHIKANEYLKIISEGVVTS